jgi:hypothetical protein
MTRIITILTLFLLSVGCEKYQYIRPVGDSIEFYRLSDFQKQKNSFKIIESSVKFSDSRIIGYDDIISYDSITCTFTITAQLAKVLDDFKNNPIHGTAFAVTVDKQLIYTGYFWAGFSSQSVDWVTIDPLNYSGKNTLRVQLGYPGLFVGDTIPDKRNDKRILDVLRRDFKLINK